MARQIAEENRGALQNADKDDGLALKIAGDFRSQFGDAFGDLLAGQAKL